MPHELRRDAYLLSDDRSLLDMDVIHGFLTDCYWSKGIPRDLVQRAIDNSMPFGIYNTSSGQPRQVGFGRVISDKATYAYLCDVFVIEPHRKRGLCQLLMQHIMSHPDLQGLRRICLLTRDAQGVYEKCGFGYLDDVRRFMQVVKRDLYLQP